MTIMLLEWVFTASFLIIVVLALRAALGKRVSTRLRYALWVVVLVRLLVPVQLFTSPIAGTWVFFETNTGQAMTEWPVTSEVRPSAEPGDVLALGGQNASSGTQSAFPQVPDPPAVPNAPEPPAAPDLTKVSVWLGWVWLTGAAAVSLVLLLSNLRFYWKLRRERVLLEEADCPLRVYMAVDLPSPCLFGILRPAIYVTPEAAADPDMLRHVLAHEYTHFRHGDHIWSLLRCGALAVHWWNPLVWVSAVLSQRDAELACDEGALKRLGNGERAGYGNTLLALVTTKPRPGDLLRCATTMVGDKKSLKERVSRIAKAPKGILWAAVAAVLVTALACVCAFGQAADQSDELDAFWPYGVSEMVYVRDKGGFGGDFRICLYRDGSFTYYEGLLSSYIGEGTWTWDGDVICLADQYIQYTWYFYFKVDGDDLIFQAENSAAFIHVDVADGDRFSRQSLEFEQDEDYSNSQTPTADGVGTAADFDVPEDVLDAAKAYAAQQFQTDVPDGWVKEWGFSYDEEIGDWVPVPLRNPVQFDQVRIKSITDDGSETVELNGENVEVKLWYFIYEYHTTMPEEAQILLAGGMYLDEDGWMYFGGCNYLAVTAGANGTQITPFLSGAGRESVMFRSDLLESLRDLQTAFPQTDLNRNGVPERIQVVTIDGGLGQRLEIWENNDNLLFSEECYSAHAGWNAIFLCTLNGTDYLLRYNPYGNQGVYHYSYQLFTLSGDGKEQVAQENSVEFDTNFSPYLHKSFDPEAIAAFMDEINGLLTHSVQLINTDVDLLAAFEKEGRLYHSLGWLDFVQTVDMPLLETLQDYKKFMEDCYSVERQLSANDLNRNGVPETLRVDVMDGRTGQRLEVWEDDELLYSEEGYFAHAGYNALFLCTLDGQDYLLRYNPYMGQGWCDYSYQLFTLSEDGEEQTVRENHLEFSINIASPMIFGGPYDGSFDPEKIAAFVDEINGLLASSVQIMNTDGDLLGTFQDKGQLVDDLWWLDIWEPEFTRDPSKSLLENLRAYQAAMESPVVRSTDMEGDELILAYKGKETRFHSLWRHVSPDDTASGTLADLDGDGRLEIVVILDAGGGTMAYMESLCVFNAETLQEYAVPSVTDDIVPLIQSTGDGENFYLSAPGMAQMAIPKSVLQYGDPVEHIEFGSYYFYTIKDGRLSCRLVGWGSAAETCGQVDVELKLAGEGIQCGRFTYAGL